MIFRDGQEKVPDFETLPHVTKIIIKHKPKNIQKNNIKKKSNQNKWRREYLAFRATQRGSIPNKVNACSLIHTCIPPLPLQSAIPVNLNSRFGIRGPSYPITTVSTPLFQLPLLSQLLHHTRASCKGSKLAVRPFGPVAPFPSSGCRWLPQGGAE
jgi:hypothetical protein